MVRRHVPFQTEAIEKAPPASHFARPSSTQSPSGKKTESVLQDCFKRDFFNTIPPLQTLGGPGKAAVSDTFNPTP
ncbi:hypothetical protein AB395_00006604 (plasmid) [Sinorhizobium fredii CCBAU 45436]|nr:hypothetical protein AB395_00006604 [Sinorhizobium fredii CCBAU 45436]